MSERTKVQAYESKIDYDAVAQAYTGHSEGEVGAGTSEFGGRADAYRDNTLTIKYDHEEAKLERAVRDAKLNLIGEMVGMVGAVGSIVDANINAWDAEAAGAKALEIEGYEGADYFKKWFSSPDTDTSFIGGATDKPMTVSSAELQNIGRAVELGAVDKLQRFDAEGNKLSLWDSIGDPYEANVSSVEDNVKKDKGYGDYETSGGHAVIEVDVEGTRGGSKLKSDKVERDEDIKKSKKKTIHGEDKIPTSEEVEAQKLIYDEEKRVKLAKEKKEDEALERQIKKTGKREPNKDLVLKQRIIDEAKGWKDVNPDAVTQDIGAGGWEKIDNLDENMWDSLNEDQLSKLEDIITRTGPGAVMEYNEMITKWGRPLMGKSGKDRFDYIIEMPTYK